MRGCQVSAAKPPRKSRPNYLEESRGCRVVRTILVGSGSLNIETGEHTVGESYWETRPCKGPLFTDAERDTLTCSACARGWNHPNNYRAGEPRPSVEGDSHV